MKKFILFLSFCIFLSIPDFTRAEDGSSDFLSKTSSEVELSPEEIIQRREVRKKVLRETLESLERVFKEVNLAREAGDIDRAAEIIKKPLSETRQKLEAVMNGDEPMDEEEETLRERHEEIADEVIEIVEEKTKKENGELIERWGTPFIRESIHKVHVNLKWAVFIADYYIACLEKNEEWFEKQVGKSFYNEPWFEENRGSFLYSEMLCSTHINSWREEIKKKYPLMRAYLTITQFRHFNLRNFFSESQPTDSAFLKAGLTDGQKESMEALEKVKKQIKRKRALVNDEQSHFAQHIFPGLVRLPLTSIEEVIFAEEIFSKNRFAIKTLSETGKLPEELKNDPHVVCVNPSPTLIVDELNNCFLEKYKEFLLGNQERSMPGLPILGYVTSTEPDDEELVKGIRQIRKNAVELLGDFRREHFVLNTETHRYSLKKRELEDRILEEKDFSFDANLDLFQFLSGRLETDSDGYKQLIEAGATEKEINQLLELGKTLYQDKIENRMWFEIGGMVVWGIGCMALLRGLLARGVCELPIGLGANLYFFVVDSQAYEKGLKYAFYRPDDSRPSYQDMSELESLSIASFASVLMLPFFTGIPQISKALRHGDDVVKNVAKRKTSRIGRGYLPWLRRLTKGVKVYR